MVGRQIFVVGHNVIKNRYSEYDVIDYLDVENLHDILINVLNKRNNVFLIMDDFNWDLEIRKGYYQIFTKIKIDMYVEYAFASLMGVKLDILELARIVDDSEMLSHIINNWLGEKRLCVVWGNCQTMVLTNMLCTNKEFCE